MKPKVYIKLEEFPAFDITKEAKSLSREDILDCIIKDLFLDYDITTTHDIKEYESIVNYNLIMHYGRYYNTDFSYKFVAYFKGNELEMILTKDGVPESTDEFLNKLILNIQKENDYGNNKNDKN